jgi:mono/diheme cytochrome c family protein
VHESAAAPHPKRCSPIPSNKCNCTQIVFDSFYISYQTANFNRKRCIIVPDAIAQAEHFCPASTIATKARQVKGGTVGNWLSWLLKSRSRVALIALALLLLLDLGRSVVARVGYAQPVERWQPDAHAYADLAWPPGTGLPAAAPSGARIYAEHCAVCHGPDGRGNGPAAPSLIPRPRDFTLGQFKYKSTLIGEAPSDADLIKTIADGLPAASMPYWRDLLSTDEIRAVVDYIKLFSTVFDKSPPTKLAMPARVASSESSIVRGRKAYEMRGCIGCHGSDGRGGLWLKDAKGYPVISRDLSAPWTFRGGSAAEQIWLRINGGLAPSPMPPLAQEATQQERWDLVNYVLSLARTPPWEPGGKLSGPGYDPDPIRRGEYLIHAQICGLCHTMINATGIYRVDDSYLAGGMRVGAYPHATLVSRNLTADLDTGLGRWSDEQIAAALRNGRSGGRVLTIMDMPWVYFHALHDDDATAIARYLKTLSPVRNRIPAPLHYGFIETVTAKLMRPLPQVPTTFLTYAEQGFGIRDEGKTPWVSPAEIQRILVDAQWLVMFLGVLAIAFAAPRGHRWPSKPRGRVALGASIAVLGLAGLVGAIIYELPQLSVIPPEQIVAGARAGIFTPDRTTLSGDEQAALADRGRYLFTVASCAICHANDGSGGAKVSWKAMGTVWTRNLTSDRETGLGGWSDAQIARAIRSGVSRNGYPLHWQAMPWDQASNWDEEDVRALISYLRLLPPVRKQIPADRAPAPDDCEVYTFWTAPSRGPGCGP